MLPIVGGLGVLGVAVAALGGGKMLEDTARQFIPQIPATNGVLGSFLIAGPAGSMATLAKNYLMPSAGVVSSNGTLF